MFSAYQPPEYLQTVLSQAAIAAADIDQAARSVSLKVRIPSYVSDYDLNNVSEEIAQVYIHANTSGMFRPEQELKGFVKVALNPGEEKQVTIALNDRSFAVWSILENDWVIEGGSYEIRVGASSRDIRLTAEIQKNGSVANPYAGEVFAPYYSGEVHQVSDESFAALLGHDIPNAKWNRNAPIGFNDTISQGEYLDGGIGKGIYNLIAFVRNVLMALEKKELGNNVMFVMNLPWRGVARMSGVLTDEQVLALIDMINRKKGGWRSFIQCLRRK